MSAEQVSAIKETTNDQQLSEMVAHFEIRKVLARYCRGVDRHDEDMINSVYWDDATDNHGIFVGPGKDFAAYIIPFLRANFDATMHVIGQSHIQVDGNQAAAETYFAGYHRKDLEGRCVMNVSGGRYVDTMERRQNEWRIRARTVVIEWFQTQPDAVPIPGVRRPNLAQFTLGSTDRSDFSYRIFADVHGV
jgi:hypothetical protein